MLKGTRASTRGVGERGQAIIFLFFWFTHLTYLIFVFIMCVYVNILCICMYTCVRMHTSACASTHQLINIFSLSRF